MRSAVSRIVLFYVVFAVVLLAATELLFEVSDGSNSEQSFAVRLLVVLLSGFALAPLLWRELRGRLVAEVRLDEQVASVDAERERRLEMMNRVSQRLSTVLDDPDEALSELRRTLTPNYYDRVHVAFVERGSPMAVRCAEGVPHLVRDLRNAPTVTEVLGEHVTEIRVAAIVPALVEDSVEAVIIAANALGRPPVDENDLEALTQVAIRLGTTLERIRLYQAATRSERRLAAVVESSPVGILEMEPGTGRILRANGSASQILRWDPTQLPDRISDDVALGELAAIWPRMSDGEIIIGRALPLDREGSTGHVEVSAAPVRGPDGAIELVVLLITDTTNRHQLEQRMQQSQRLESLGRLAGGVAHDFNNLLTVIIGYTDLAMRRMPKDDPQRADLGAVMRAGEQARDLTDQLLTVSKRRIVQAEAVDPNEVVRSIAQVLHRLVGDDIDLQIVTDDVDEVMIDRSQLEQVLLNLVVNARDAMAEGGQLSMSTVRGTMPGQPEPSTIIRVADTGSGMDEDTAAHCFEPFFTTKGGQDGTGLGLSTVYGVVAQAGGDIVLETDVGRGTTFSVHLPTVKARAAAPAPEQTDGSEVILLVDDEPEVRRLARRSLESEGYAVVEAGSGGEALATLQDGAAIDLLVTDVVMPGMNGVETARRVHEQVPDLPVLYVSGFAEDPALHEVGVGAFNFLAKPFDVDQLLRAVRRTLDERSDAGAT